MQHLDQKGPQHLHRRPHSRAPVVLGEGGCLREIRFPKVLPNKLHPVKPLLLENIPAMCDTGHLWPPLYSSGSSYDLLTNSNTGGHFVKLLPHKDL